MSKTIQVNAAPHPRWRSSGASEAHQCVRKGFRMLSTKEVEERVHRAIMTLYALPEKGRIAQVGSFMPDFLREYSESYGSDGARSVLFMQSKFVPEPRDIDEMWEAFDWWRGLSKDEYRLLEARAFGVSYAKIALMAGSRTGQYWSYTYKAVLNCVADQANKKRKKLS